MNARYLLMFGLIIGGAYSVFVAIRSCWVASAGCIDLGVQMLPGNFIIGCVAFGVAAYLHFRRP